MAFSHRARQSPGSRGRGTTASPTFVGLAASFAVDADRIVRGLSDPIRRSGHHHANSPDDKPQAFSTAFSLREAARGAAILRLRPRLMTTIPIVLGFLPLALNLHPGGELLRPMAAAAIGGLLVEMLVAILLVPALYTWISPKQRVAG